MLCTQRRLLKHGKSKDVDHLLKSKKELQKFIKDAKQACPTFSMGEILCKILDMKHEIQNPEDEDSNSESRLSGECFS